MPIELGLQQFKQLWAADKRGAMWEPSWAFAACMSLDDETLEEVALHNRVDESYQSVLAKDEPVNALMEAAPADCHHILIEKNLGLAHCWRAGRVCTAISWSGTFSEAVLLDWKVIRLDGARPVGGDGMVRGHFTHVEPEHPVGASTSAVAESTDPVAVGEPSVAPIAGAATAVAAARRAPSAGRSAVVLGLCRDLDGCRELVIAAVALASET